MKLRLRTSFYHSFKKENSEKLHLDNHLKLTIGIAALSKRGIERRKRGTWNKDLTQERGKESPLDDSEGGSRKPRDVY